jgi:hypothetical protein
MRRLNRDSEGSAVIIVLLCFTALVGIGAVVVDVGALLHEKRQLQNGADAAALAIAEACGAGVCADPAAVAAEYASANAGDGVSGIEDICGEGLPSLAPCAVPPAVPAGAGYVQVTTDTLETDGSADVPYHFAQVFGLTGGHVRARAVAAWGGAAGLTSELPLTISECELDAYTNGGTTLQNPPPYDATNPVPAAHEAVIYLHDTTGSIPNDCPAGPSGADLPGGFGWLDTTDGCKAVTTGGNWFDDKTGVPPPTDCKPALMAAMVGQVVKIPIFVDTNGLNGTNGQYLIGPYAAFYLTGYSINGQYQEKSIITGTAPCKGQATCISGIFVKWDYGVEGTIGGPSMGVTVVALVG